jgi:LPXTG-site transpeptidase (sortase) family protein
VAKTIYRVEGGSPDRRPAESRGSSTDPFLEPALANISSDARPRAARRRLLWILIGIAILTVAMIAVIAALGASESPAEGTLLGPVSSSTTVPTVPVTSNEPVAASTTVAPTTSSSITSSLETTTSTSLVHPINDPARLVIPALGVDGKIVPVGLKNSVAMEIPPVGLVGWYKLGAVPGASGPSVLVSHVSWQGKKGVFYKLKDMKVGDQFTVYDASGDSALFQVDATETVLKTDLPTEKIWNDTDEPVIRLITCGGTYDSKSGHYLSNVIVYARLIK